MKQLTEILPDVFVIEVEADAAEIDIEGNFLFFKRDFVGFNCVGTMKPLPEGKWQYLGYCTKDEISFDVEQYLEEFKYEPIFESRKNQVEQSFRSLLLKHGLFWENPIKQPLRTNFRIKELSFSEEFNLFKNAHNAWQQNEANKLTGKLVVLKKVK